MVAKIDFPQHCLEVLEVDLQTSDMCTLPSPYPKWIWIGKCQKNWGGDSYFLGYLTSFVTILGAHKKLPDPESEVID